MKYTVLIEVRGTRRYCKGVFDTRRRAERALVDYYREGLILQEEMTPEQIEAAVEEVDGCSYVINDDYSDTDYYVTTLMD